MELLASALAAPTGLLADSAVLVHLGVSFALITAARDHVGQVVLGQVTVDVGSAGLRAVGERVDGRYQQASVDAGAARMGVQ